MNDLTRTQLFPILLELITNVSASSTRLWTSFRILASLLSPAQRSTHSKYSMTVIKNPHENDVFAIRQKNRKASTEAPDGMYSTSLAIREHVFVLALGWHPSCPMSLLYRGFPRWGCWITWGKFGSFLDSQFNFLLIMTFLDTGFLFFFWKLVFKGRTLWARLREQEVLFCFGEPTFLWVWTRAGWASSPDRLLLGAERGTY